MSRFAVVVLSASAFAPAAAAPVPKHMMKPPGPGYYFPTVPGATWIYDEADGEGTYVVSKVEDRKGTKVVTVERDVKGQRVPEEVMEVSAAGYARTHAPHGPLAGPLVILKVPFKIGDSWTINRSGTEGTKTVAAVETITLPAGTFEAVRVETAYTIGGQQRVCRAWYAPGVGLLKMTTDGHVNYALKAFAPGQE